MIEESNNLRNDCQFIMDEIIALFPKSPYHEILTKVLFVRKLCSKLFVWYFHGSNSNYVIFSNLFFCEFVQSLAFTCICNNCIKCLSNMTIMYTITCEGISNKELNYYDFSTFGTGHLEIL